MKYIAILIIISGSLFSQNYNTAIGLRGGLFNGITAKHFIGKETAIEGLVTGRWGGFNITGLYQMYEPAFNAKGLYWYYGGGVHAGFFDENEIDWNGRDDNDGGFVFGVDGIVGIEYNFQKIPFNISLDWKPTLNFIGWTGLWLDAGGISVRYKF